MVVRGLCQSLQLTSLSKSLPLLYFAMYNVNFLAQIFEGKIRMCMIYGMMITYHGCNNGHNNPVYNVHKNMGTHYTWARVICSKIWYLPTATKVKLKRRVYSAHIKDTP